MNQAKSIESLPIEMPAAPGALIQVLRKTARGFMTHVVPPLLVIGVLLIIWQLLGSRPGAALPAPSKVVQDTWELIIHPFYDRGGNDVGIAWQLLASLKRV
ncbi:MAG: nitrate ABC transporter, permease protein, partial [Ramlibacter sp.]